MKVIIVSKNDLYMVKSEISTYLLCTLISRSNSITIIIIISMRSCNTQSLRKDDIYPNMAGWSLFSVYLVFWLQRDKIIAIIEMVSSDDFSFRDVRQCASKFWLFRGICLHLDGTIDVLSQKLIAWFFRCANHIEKQSSKATIINWNYK